MLPDSRCSSGPSGSVILATDLAAMPTASLDGTVRFWRRLEPAGADMLGDRDLFRRFLSLVDLD